jgi:hypothetical protein
MQRRLGQPVKTTVGCLAAIGLVLVGYGISNLIHTAQALQCIQGDVARRVTAPSGQQTALLVRALFFDLNFRLYLVDIPADPVPCQVTEALWSSPDYEPTTRRNWHEEIEWSADSAILAVRIEQEYVFAYDFSSGQATDDSNQIEQLLTLHSKPQQ